MTRKDILLYTKFIKDRYNYIRMTNNGLSNAIKNRNVDLCKVLIDEMKKDIEIIDLLKSLIEKK